MRGLSILLVTGVASIAACGGKVVFERQGQGGDGGAGASSAGDGGITTGPPATTDGATTDGFTTDGATTDGFTTDGMASTSSGAGGGTPSEACSACAAAQPCEAELDACNQQPPCGSLIGCLIGCDFTYECLDACWAGNPGGHMKYLDLIECSVCPCFDVCAGSSVATFCLEG